jgi:hypothetical protein
VLENSGHDVDKDILDTLTRFCVYCQKHDKSPGRFRFILHVDIEFNCAILVNIIYIDSKPILHVIDEATRFQAARWFETIYAKYPSTTAILDLPINSDVLV